MNNRYFNANSFPNNKYSARKVTLDGITFDSVAESNRYCQLRLLEKAGFIANLRVHTRLTIWEALHIKVRPIVYEVDFDYTDSQTGVHVFEDVKGFRTRDYQIKKKMVMDKLAGEFGSKAVFKELKNEW